MNRPLTYLLIPAVVTAGLSVLANGADNKAQKDMQDKLAQLTSDTASRSAAVKAALAKAEQSRGAAAGTAASDALAAEITAQVNAATAAATAAASVAQSAAYASTARSQNTALMVSSFCTLFALLLKTAYDAWVRVSDNQRTDRQHAEAISTMNKTANTLETVEKQTNSMSERLAQKTGEVEHRRGLDEGLATGRAEKS